MVDLIAQLLGVVGGDFSSPVTVGNFFTYFFSVTLAFCIVAGFLQLIRFTVATITKGAPRL